MAKATQRLSTIGKQLSHPPHTKDSILKQLKQAAEILSEMKQSQDMKASLDSLVKALVLPALIKHKDKDVRLLTMTCIMEILRIVAPDAPYSDKELQEIFEEVVSAFHDLKDISSSSYARRTVILEIIANLRLCVLMLDVGCDDAIMEMFQIFFSVAIDKHSSSVLAAMQTIMVATIEESETIPLPMLDLILKQLLKQKKGVSSVAHKLAVGVVQQCADKLEPYVQRLLTSVMLEGREAEVDLHEHYHDIIYEIYQCAPQMLLAVIPNFTQELVNDQINVRLKAVKLLGRLFALPDHHMAKEYRQLYLEFLKRFTDKAVEVRLAMINCVKECLKANPSASEMSEILDGLDDRILDSEETVRLQTVAAICDVAKQNFRCIPVSLLKHVADRLRDKKVLVRKETFSRLAEVYRTYASKCCEGIASVDKQLEWIPGKLLRCCYDKDVKEFRPAALEVAFVERLFPRQTSVHERIKHWISMYSVFEENDRKALIKVLSQKRRLQEEMSKYLALRQRGKESGHEDPDIQQLLKAMTLFFVDDGKVEEHFQKLHSMKDNKIFKALSQLLDPQTSFSESESIKEELLKRIGEHHPQHEFFKVLAVRCSYLIFGKDHTKAVMEEISLNMEDSNREIVVDGLTLVAEIAGFFPSLVKGVKEDLLTFLLEGDSTIKEKVADILAKAGSSFRDQMDGADRIELTLQKLCLEGTRKQAKYAVAALSAINADDGFKTLSVLYGHLVKELRENNPFLPTILQSLSSIAEISVPIFETQEDDIVRFVVRSLLQKDSVIGDGVSETEDGENINTTCKLKIFGLKTLVKSFLPLKQQPRKRLRGLLGLLSKLVPNGDISESSKSSEIDKAQLRLASVKGLLRLARRWDTQIPPPVFHLCMFTAQDSCADVRHGFLKKLHQYLKDHTLHHKYASGYALFSVESGKDVVTEAKHYLVEFFESARIEAKTQKRSTMQSDISPVTYNPEYILVYLVHLLAYHPSFPAQMSETADAYELFYRSLLFFLRPLVHQDHEGIIKGDGDNLPAILAIFRTIKKAEDALAGKKTSNIRILCDLGIIITKELGSNLLYTDAYPGLIPLPYSFYSSRKDSDDGPNMVDGSDLPACLTDDDFLSQLWLRASRPGQMHPLGLNQQTRRTKRDTDLSSSSDQHVEKDTKDAESVQVMPETEKRIRSGHKSPQKKTQKRRRTRSRTMEESDTSGSDFEEDENIKGGGHRIGRHLAAQQSDDAPLPLKIGTRPVRMTRSQTVGIHVLERTTVESDSEEGQDDGTSSPSHKYVAAKRVKLGKHLDEVDTTMRETDEHLSSIEEEGKRPQTRTGEIVEAEPVLRSSTDDREENIVAGMKDKEMQCHAANGVEDQPDEQPSFVEKVHAPQRREKVPAEGKCIESSSDEEDETLATWRTRRRNAQ